MPQISTVILTNTVGVLNVTGDKFKGDGYYGLTDGLHTVGWYFVDFIGRIKIQASLEQDPQSTDWFDVDLDGTGNGYIEFLTDTDGMKIYNFTGNFVWIRADVNRSHDGTLTTGNSGSIAQVLYNY